MAPKWCNKQLHQHSEHRQNSKNVYHAITVLLDNNLFKVIKSSTDYEQAKCQLKRQIFSPPNVLILPRFVGMQLSQKGLPGPTNPAGGFYPSLNTEASTMLNIPSQRKYIGGGVDKEFPFHSNT